MYQLSKIKFSMWTDGKSPMCSITADIPDNDGLRYLTFYMTAGEFETICDYGNIMVSDLAHKLEAYHDVLKFYDMEWPSEKSGSTQVKFYNADFPVFTRKMLLKIAKRVWFNGPQDGTRTELCINPKRFERWSKLYSQASGNVKLVMDDVSKNYFEERLSEPDNNLRENVDRLLTIAKNGTRRFWHTGKVLLSKDWDGFYFRIIGPNGNCTLNGGVVDHGEKGSKWSIHT